MKTRIAKVRCSTCDHVSTAWEDTSEDGTLHLCGMCGSWNAS